MKAERRHELKTNTLAQGIEGLPVFWRQHGTKVLLAVVAVLAVVLFVRFQRNAARQEQELAAESYANALAAIDNVRDPRLSADQRRDIQQSTMAALQQVLDSSNNDALRANALLAQGDLHWHLAHTIELPTGATTQAAQTRPAGRDDDADNLERAQKAYEAVLQAPGAKPATLTSARLALAAIAEEQGKWDEAAKQYDAVVNDAAMPETFKAEARLRKADLEDLRKPALIGGAPTRPIEEPTTAPLGPVGPAAPATTTTATAPTTRPTTQTQPATGTAVER
jgi:hypothetical protein